MDEFDWTAYRELAKKLAAETDDASQRSAVSRAYYYIYNLARRRVEGIDYQYVPGTGTHKSMWLVWIQNPEAACKKAGMIGQRLQGERERADYDDHFPKLAETTERVLAEVQQFAKLLAQLRPDQPKQVSQRHRP